jgi:hypothetical protein
MKTQCTEALQFLVLIIHELVVDLWGGDIVIVFFWAFVFFYQIYVTCLINVFSPTYMHVHFYYQTLCISLYR